ncbi:MAG: hypothetical protein AAFP17_19400 [Pseudomonadota bacterium]
MSAPEQTKGGPLTFIAALLAAALAFGVLTLGDWLAGEVPGLAAMLPGGARRTLSVLRYPAAFVALLLALSTLAPLIDAALRRLIARR